MTESVFVEDEEEPETKSKMVFGEGYAGCKAAETALRGLGPLMVLAILEDSEEEGGASGPRRVM